MGERKVGNLRVFLALRYLVLSDTMERPLEDTTTAMLWKTLLATIVELSLGSGLFTEEELTPPLVAPTGSEMAQPHEHSKKSPREGEWGSEG